MIMSKMRYYLVPIVFMIGYLAVSLLFTFFIDNAIVVSYIADIMTAVVGIIYIKKFIGTDGTLKPTFKQTFLMTLVIIILWFVCQLISTWLYGFSNDTNFDKYTELIQSHLVSYIILSVIVAPITEEILMRGIIFGSINKHNKIAAYVISIAVFTLMHGTFTHIPVTVLFGLIFAFVYDITGNLLYSILIHFANNLFSVFLTGIIVPSVMLTGPVAITFYIISLLLVVFFVIGYYKKSSLKE